MFEIQSKEHMSKGYYVQEHGIQCTLVSLTTTVLKITIGNYYVCENEHLVY